MTDAAGVVVAYAVLVLAVCGIGLIVASVCQAADAWTERREAKRRAQNDRPRIVEYVDDLPPSAPLHQSERRWTR